MPEGGAGVRERLQKVLARAGVASRRRAEEMIRRGEVAVNGRVVTEPGTTVDPEADRITVGGKTIRSEPPVYIMLHKPRGYVSTCHDPQGRRTVLDLVGEQGARLYPVGRLDFDSAGLLILTNDGGLTHALTHPRHGVEKTYRVTVAGRVKDADLEILRHGVELADGRTAPARVSVVRSGEAETGEAETTLDISIHEGRNRQVRRMLAALGYEVRSLTRTSLGGLELGALAPGRHRHLSAAEVEKLRSAAGLPGPASEHTKAW